MVVRWCYDMYWYSTVPYRTMHIHIFIHSGSESWKQISRIPQRKSAASGCIHRCLHTFIMSTACVCTYAEYHIKYMHMPYLYSEYKYKYCTCSLFAFLQTVDEKMQWFTDLKVFLFDFRTTRLPLVEVRICGTWKHKFKDMRLFWHINSFKWHRSHLSSFEAAP